VYHSTRKPVPEKLGLEGPPMSRIAVIGAGIGGLTVASLLADSDHAVTIFEQAATLKPLGAALALAPNAMWVLRQLGLADQVAHTGSRVTRYRYLTANGQVLREFSLNPLMARWQEAAWCVPRWALQSALFSRIDPSQLFLNRPVRAIRPTADHVDVLSATDEQWSFDAVIGADGLHSVVRPAVDPNTGLTFAQFIAYRGVAEGQLPASYQDMATEVWGGRQQFGFSQMGPGRIYWYATDWTSSDDPRRPWEALGEQLCRWTAPVAEIVSATPRDQILTHPIYFRRWRGRWGCGRVTTLGDAAHAMTPNLGQGGCQAMLDAWTLSRCLVQEPRLDEALRHYERIRAPRAHRMAQLSYRMGRIGHWAGAAGETRNALVRMLPPALWNTLLAFGFGTPARELGNCLHATNGVD
jgi:2-polyprenyl-6-methoxyphenol hydroxylase-like FAD-dependent oxidoreductase